MSAKDFFLFWGSGSPPCWRVMMALEEKGFTGYPNKRIEFSKQEHKAPDILELNPRGQVPTFRHGGIVINESSGICHYLESEFKNKGTQLIPDEPVKKALVLQRMYESENLFDKGIRKLYFYAMFNKDSIDQKVLAEKKKELSEELSIWEKRQTDQYICGPKFTMADIFVFPYFAFFVRGSLNLDTRPNIKKYYGTMTQRPSVQASWPPHFKTSPPNEIYKGV